MPSPYVLYQQEKGIAFLTFNRPETRNAMTDDMYQTLVEHCELTDKDQNIKVLILRGAGGKVFVAGSDVSKFKTSELASVSMEHELYVDKVIQRLETVSKPTIAQVEGMALGSGLALVAACDLCVCTPSSKFGVPIARTLGNCLSVSNHILLLELLGQKRLKDLLYTGRLLDAEEALSCGLVTRIADSNLIEDSTKDLACSIASNAPLTIKASKETIRRIRQRNQKQTTKENDLSLMCYSSEDFKEGVEAFLTKRNPNWKGT